MNLLRDIFSSQIKLALAVFLGMIAVIASVLAFEHLGGYIPCALCLKQRIPYYAGIPFALIALIAILMNGPNYLVRGALIISGLLVLISLILGAYHSGVEWAWWAGPSECGGAADSGGATTSAENLMTQMSFSKPPSCSEAAGRFLGMSFAGWNVVVSAIIAILAFRGAIIIRKK